MTKTTSITTIIVSALGLGGLSACDSWTNYPEDKTPTTSKDMNQGGNGSYGGINSAYDNQESIEPGNNPPVTPGTSTYGGSNTAGGNPGTVPNISPGEKR